MKIAEKERPRIVIGGALLFGGEGIIGKAMLGMLIYQAIGNLMNLTDIDLYDQDVVRAIVVVAVVGASILATRCRRATA